MTDSEPRRLLDDLATVGASLAPSDLPAAANLGHVVGALIKVLDAGGTKVDEELLKAPELVSAGPARPPETGAVQHDPTRLDRIEHALAKLLDNLADDEPSDTAVAPPASSSSTPPAAAPPPFVPPPADPSSTSSPSSSSSS